MENKEKLFLTVQKLRLDCAKKQKKGLHFILTSVGIWIGIMMIHLSPLPIITKNLLTFFCSVPLMPIAYFVAKLIKVDFQNKGNPLTNLGILFSVNQILYILIAMWVYSSTPNKMLMVYAIIFGAHLLPYGWLYRSKTYYAFSIMLPLLSLAIGLNFSPAILAMIMVFAESIFCISLLIENKKLFSASRMNDVKTP
jgi:hypothetical protein